MRAGGGWKRIRGVGLGRDRERQEHRDEHGRLPATHERCGTGAEREHHRFQEEGEEREREAGAEGCVAHFSPAHERHQSAVDQHQLDGDERARATALLCEEFHNLAEENEVEERDELPREERESVVGMRRGQD